MVRIRGNAKRKRDESFPETNFQEETGGNAKRNERAPPPPTKDETGGETSCQRGKNGGETDPPSQEGTGGEEPSSSTSTSSTSSTSSEETTDNEITVTIDPDTLNCPICFDPLRSPIYQCILGHTVCVACWEKVQYECPTCNKPKGPQNCALEKMLEAIYLPCPNANYGCHESVSYSQMEVHTETCEFGPSPGGSASDSMAEKTKRRKTGGEEETTGRNKIQVTIDCDSLECGICSDPLCPPLYQCINDHIVCYSCYKKVQYKCPLCDKPIGNQNIALEKMLESIHLSCPHANFGCSQSLSYSQMEMHTKTCEFGPSLCPIQGCGHEAFSGEWKSHFLKDHYIRSPYFGIDPFYFYGRSCTVTFDEDDLYLPLFGPDKDLFMLVKEPIPNVGNALSLYYIDLPDQGQKVFTYELILGAKVNYMTRSVKLNSHALSIKEWKRGEVRCSSLLIPKGFRERSMVIYVLINKE